MDYIPSGIYEKAGIEDVVCLKQVGLEVRFFLINLMLHVAEMQIKGFYGNLDFIN